MCKNLTEVNILLIVSRKDIQQNVADKANLLTGKECETLQMLNFYANLNQLTECSMTKCT